MTDKTPRFPPASSRARWLKLMDEVRAPCRPIVITKRGKPVPKLVPVEEETASPFGRLEGTVTIHGDIISPIDRFAARAQAFVSRRAPHAADPRSRPAGLRRQPP